MRVHINPLIALSLRGVQVLSVLSIEVRRAPHGQAKGRGSDGLAQLDLNDSLRTRLLLQCRVPDRREGGIRLRHQMAQKGHRRADRFAVEDRVRRLSEQLMRCSIEPTP